MFTGSRTEGGVPNERCSIEHAWRLFPTGSPLGAKPYSSLHSVKLRLMYTSLSTRPRPIRADFRPFRPAKRDRNLACRSIAPPGDDASQSSRLSRREAIGVAAAGAVAGMARPSKAEDALPAPVAAPPAPEPGVAGDASKRQDRVELGHSGGLPIDSCADASACNWLPRRPRRSSAHVSCVASLQIEWTCCCAQRSAENFVCANSSSSWELHFLHVTSPAAAHAPRGAGAHRFTSQRSLKPCAVGCRH